MKILRVSNVCLVGALVLGLMVAMSNGLPQEMSTHQAISNAAGGCCCLSAHFYNCTGILCFNGCNLCKNGSGIRLCYYVSQRCTSLICNNENCADWECHDSALCHSSLSRVPMRGNG